MTDAYLAQIEPPSHTPWGSPDSIEPRRPGIFFLGTPSHGGFWVTPELNARIPAYMRLEDGWYEEDCDWAIVATVFPDAVGNDAEMIALAGKTLRDQRPDAYSAFHGVTVQPEESAALREANFYRENRHRQVVVAAWGYPLSEASREDGLAKGEVLVVAMTGGRGNNFKFHPDAHETWHIVPAAAYRARSSFGYVIPDGTPETDLRPYPVNRD